MEFLHEGIALGIDLVILRFCVKEYMGYKRNVNLLRVRIQVIKCIIERSYNAAVSDNVAIASAGWTVKLVIFDCYSQLLKNYETKINLQRSLKTN